MTQPSTSGSEDEATDRYDRFAEAVDTPMLVLTILWLPVLIVPLASAVHGAVAESFATVDYTVWAFLLWSTSSSCGLHHIGAISLRPTCSTSSLVGPCAVLPTAAHGSSRPATAADTRWASLWSRAPPQRTIHSHGTTDFTSSCLAAGVLVFVCAGLVTFAERNTPRGANHSRTSAKDSVGPSSPSPLLAMATATRSRHSVRA